jgi:hypothetical protein
MTPVGQEIAIRAVATALAGLSVAFAGYMLAHGGERVRVNGIEHLAIFAQPRGAVADKPLVLPALTDGTPALDMTTTGSFDASPPRPPASRPVEIVAARADRVWLSIDGVIRSARLGDDLPRVGRIAAIVPRDGGWALVGDNGATLLTVTKRANGASLLARERIFK